MSAGAAHAHQCPGRSSVHTLLSFCRLFELPAACSAVQIYCRPTYEVVEVWAMDTKQVGSREWSNAGCCTQVPLLLITHERSAANTPLPQLPSRVDALLLQRRCCKHQDVPHPPATACRARRPFATSLAALW